MNKDRKYDLFDKASLILTGLTFAAMIIATIYEDITVKLLMSLLAPTLVFIISIPGRFVGVRLLNKADSYTTVFKRTVFYILTFLISMAIFAAAAAIIYFIYDSQPATGGMAEGIGRILIMFLFIGIALILVLLPILLTVVVLIMRRFMKKSEAEDEAP